MKNILNKVVKLMDTEAFRYVFVGGCTTLVNLISFAILCNIIHLNINVSNIISVFIAILFAYVTNKFFVFLSHCNNFKELYLEFSKFLGARLATMVIEVGGVFLLYEIIGQNEMIAKLETQFLVLIGNFFISKFIVFKNKGDE